MILFRQDLIKISIRICALTFKFKTNIDKKAFVARSLMPKIIKLF